MPQSWTNALDSYDYPVELADYQGASNFPNFFKRHILGDRYSTMAFEDYFRENAQNIEVWCEVVFWKLYSQKGRGDTNTKKCWDFWREKTITGKELCRAANNFIANHSKDSFNEYRQLWPFYGSRVIAVIATPIAFLVPDRFPMVDTRVAKWIDSQLDMHNNGLNNPQLIRSRYGQTESTVLTMADFNFYLHWVHWAEHTAKELSQQTEMKWRARDVEMAVFTAWGDRGYSHPRLPLHRIQGRDGTSHNSGE